MRCSNRPMKASAYDTGTDEFAFDRVSAADTTPPLRREKRGRAFLHVATGSVTSSQENVMLTAPLTLPGEEWRPIPGYEGLYMASNLGRIRSLDRVVPCLRGTRIHRGRVLKQGAHPLGYMMVATCSHGERESHAVHRLVIRAFKGVPGEGMQTCHNDGNPANNHISNLRYDTTVNNHADKRKHGTLLMGEACAYSTITDDIVIEMRQRRASGESLPSLVKDYGMSKANISRICRGELWTHVGGPISKIYSRSLPHAPA